MQGLCRLGVGRGKHGAGLRVGGVGRIQAGSRVVQRVQGGRSEGPAGVQAISWLVTMRSARPTPFGQQTYGDLPHPRRKPRSLLATHVSAQSKNGPAQGGNGGSRRKVQAQGPSKVLVANWNLGREPGGGGRPGARVGSACQRARGS